MWGVGQTEIVCIDILNFYPVLRYDNKKDVSDSEIYINGQEVKKCKQRESMKQRKWMCHRLLSSLAKTMK